MHGAERTDLAGQWEIMEDPEDAGLRERWCERPPGAGWRSIAVPSAWQTVLDDAGADVAWYRRRTRVPKVVGEGSRLWLKFLAVATDARVWVNGREVGRHIGDWVPFEFDVTEAAGEEPEAEVIVRVDRVRPGPVREIDGHPRQGGHITKGFHDILSIQHAGIWQGVTLERSGPLRILPDGLGLTADAETGRVRADVELGLAAEAGSVRVEIRDAAGNAVAEASAPVSAGQELCTLELEVSQPELWSCERPVLYTAEAVCETAEGLSDTASARFGFRRVTTGGPDNTQILLNGVPTVISGMLDWGHEPEHMSPAPPREELLARFRRLREMGFNCVCICMWYPPREFYEVADETGMLLWQEHPVWKSLMGDEHAEEYKRQFTKFFRLDRNHPSVAIVSGSCEHETFNPVLAEWWWGEARRLMSDRLLQIQTAFLEWTDLEKTDLYDEHTYDSSGRWVRYLQDLSEELRGRERKPIVMGESVLYVAWPDPSRIRERSVNGELPWFAPAGLDAIEEFQREVTEEYGEEAFAQFLRDAAHFCLRGRKFQTECVRAVPDQAGLVQNHLRDVHACPCGFMDQLGAWRFTPEQTRPWLSPAIHLLQAPGHRSGFPGGTAVRPRIGVSNYSDHDCAGPVRVTVRSGDGTLLDAELPVETAQGEISWAEFAFDVPKTDKPVPITVEALSEGVEPNRWTLWTLPPARSRGDGFVRLDGAPFTNDELSLDFEEKRYSSGWGLAVHSWSPLPPDPGVLAPEAAPWTSGRPGAPVITHRMTDGLCDYLEAGGRVLLLPSKASGGPLAKTVNMWGQNPLIRAAGPLEAAGTAWVLDLLDYDLAERWIRSVPTLELGIVDDVEPLVRLVYTHDMTDRVKVYDSLFTARVGRGLLTVSSLDHHGDAGRYLLGEILAWLGTDGASSDGELSAETVRSWARSGSAAHQNVGS